MSKRIVCRTSNCGRARFSPGRLDLEPQDIALCAERGLCRSGGQFPVAALDRALPDRSRAVTLPFGFVINAGRDQGQQLFCRGTAIDEVARPPLLQIADGVQRLEARSIRPVHGVQTREQPICHLPTNEAALGLPVVFQPQRHAARTRLAVQARHQVQGCIES